ncbi:MAG: carbohydrate ABC transporter permease [Acetivibrionales bacterium]|nr:carbohydrate ABC transporter permease [Bacillota bacterium]NLP08576.1 carbohydrate ABC transporter permease [Clostridiaceae bacterium]HOA54910.1 carbohydrate ABC transporter permease [Clostridiales bacterium]HPZ04563.1 carbohydrate ABC transporter permease [Clostridiales bacterium]HQD31411.1 carbohydrate ABC transporter permease [Clostridiales bacterium]
MNKGRTLPKRKARPIQETITVAVLSLVSLTYLYPLLWLIINSLKTDTEMFIDPWSVIPSFQFDNYATAWVSGKIGTSFFNSVMVSFTSVGVTIVVASMAAFALKRFKWKLSGFVMGLFLIGVMIPIHSTLIPLFMVFNKIGLLNKHISLVLPYVAFALPTSIFILSGFMATFPKEIEEAAVIDGCSMKGVFWRIIFPLSKSSIATISIFNFVTAWNELMFALIFMTSDSKMTLPVSLTRFKGQYSTSWTIQLAAVVIMVLPSLIAYFFLNDKIIKSLTIGAVKG